MIRGQYPATRIQVSQFSGVLTIRGKEVRFRLSRFHRPERCTGLQDVSDPFIEQPLWLLFFAPQLLQLTLIVINILYCIAIETVDLSNVKHEF